MSEEPESNLMYVRGIINGGLILQSEMAIKLAEVFLCYTYSEQHLEQQRPLVATERNEKWYIEGSYNKVKNVGDLGPALVILEKKNGRVLECAIPKIGTGSLSDLNS